MSGQNRVSYTDLYKHLTEKKTGMNIYNHIYILELIEGKNIET